MGCFTLLELSADGKYLGAKPGFTSILHTWGSNMEYHPHLHILLTGGGLAEDGGWHEKKDHFFLPVKVVSRLFRGKFMAGLKALEKNGTLSYVGLAEKYHNHYEFQQLVDACYKKEWVPFIKESYAGAETAMEYIGRYTHRIAISNSRILSMDGESVTFRVKDYRSGGAFREERISGVEFIRRFLMHVLPKGFIKIRHYGLLGNRNKKSKIPLCRNLTGCLAYLSRLKGLDSGEILKQLYGLDIHKCPCCGGRIQIHKSRHGQDLHKKSG